jgi:WD40 repeat protein
MAGGKLHLLTGGGDGAVFDCSLHSLLAPREEEHRQDVRLSTTDIPGRFGTLRCAAFIGDSNRLLCCPSFPTVLSSFDHDEFVPMESAGAPVIVTDKNVTFVTDVLIPDTWGDGHLCACGDGAGSISMFVNVGGAVTPLAQETCHRGGVLSIWLSSHDDGLVKCWSSGFDGTFLLRVLEFDKPSGQVRVARRYSFVLPQPRKQLAKACAILPLPAKPVDLVVVGDTYGSVHVFPIEDGATPAHTLSGVHHRDPVSSISFWGHAVSLDDLELASTGGDGKVSRLQLITTADHGPELSLLGQTSASFDGGKKKLLYLRGVWFPPEDVQHAVVWGFFSTVLVCVLLPLSGMPGDRTFTCSFLLLKTRLTQQQQQIVQFSRACSVVGTSGFGK